jgi:hypothetical protein
MFGCVRLYKRTFFNRLFVASWVSLIIEKTPIIKLFYIMCQRQPFSMFMIFHFWINFLFSFLPTKTENDFTRKLKEKINIYNLNFFIVLSNILNVIDLQTHLIDWLGFNANFSSSIPAISWRLHLFDEIYSGNMHIRCMRNSFIHYVYMYCIISYGILLASSRSSTIQFLGFIEHNFILIISIVDLRHKSRR